jgi:hypothetical protein
VQNCGLTMPLGHYCDEVATRMVEAQGSPGLIVKAADRWPVGPTFWSNVC